MGGASTGTATDGGGSGNESGLGFPGTANTGGGGGGGAAGNIGGGDGGSGVMFFAY
jgi:hypothetical protein